MCNKAVQRVQWISEHKHARTTLETAIIKNNFTSLFSFFYLLKSLPLLSFYSEQ